MTKQKETEPYIRKCNNKFILEKKVDGKTIYLGSLNPKKLEEMFRRDRLEKVVALVPAVEN